MRRDEMFKLAEAEAKAADTCPVNLLEAFYANHWDFGTLCAGFACEECVATLEDIGYCNVGEDDGPAHRNELEEDWEIPF
ncbi:MAG: hypothetical protein Q4D27_09465 [Coriobacteriia bacterium]|nr:hypothetical protein [Coriobacteriia bacterium]